MKKGFVTKTVAALLALFLLLPSASAQAAGYSSVSSEAKTKVEKQLLTAEEFSYVDENGVVGVRASYTVNGDNLATLEEEYFVTFGALVAREANGYTKAKLTLKHNEKKDLYESPYNVAMLTVYSSEGTRPVNAQFSSDEMDSFGVTVNLKNKTVERTQSKIVMLAFVILEDRNGQAEDRVYYVSRGGSPYGAHPSYDGMMRADFFANREDQTAMDQYVDFVQTQIKSDVRKLSETPVYICGKDSDAHLTKENKAIWVEYLPELDPYPDVKNDPEKSGVRAAYIYYPLDFDPSNDYSTTALKEAGARRVFVYIGTPQGEDLPGLVCVHGGGGHAYAEYALEAVREGYAAVAIDTEGCFNVTGGSKTYSAADANYTADVLGHKGKDSFANVEDPLTEQWLYYAVMDTVLANCVLRSMDTVNEDAVGITGISWGGLVTTTAICYDHRYAFASPIYIAFHMAESYGISVGGLKEKPFAVALWQDTELLKACPVPTLIISCENDLFASVDTVSKTVHDMPNATLLIKPRLLHGQQYGASLPEIYEFGYNVLEGSNGFITVKEQPTADMGLNYTLTPDIPEGATDVSATLYYLDQPIFEYSDRKAVYYEAVALTVNDDGTVSVNVPNEACVYFISFSYYNEDVYNRQIGTPYLGSYKNSGNTDDETKPEKTVKYEQGYVCSSTDIVYLP